MGAALAVLRPLAFVNEHVLRIGRGIGIVAVALMVVAILIQVFFRYVLNNALPWPDEAARFCMLWMTGLMAPTAFRRGGFVSIDMAVRALPTRVGAIVSLFLLLISLAVLIVAAQIGWSEVTVHRGAVAEARRLKPEIPLIDQRGRPIDEWAARNKPTVMAAAEVTFRLHC